jgi:hypothetical protein
MALKRPLNGCTTHLVLLVTMSLDNTFPVVWKSTHSLSISEGVNKRPLATMYYKVWKCSQVHSLMFPYTIPDNTYVHQIGVN